MKKFSLILAIVMVASMIAALPTSAAHMSSTEILKGTPVVDGVYDEIYGQSANYVLDAEDLGAVYDTFQGAPDTSANAYFLWDDNFLYMCIYVEDADVTTIGPDTIKSKIESDGPNSCWANDAVESWFVVGDEYIMKVHTDAFGYNFYGSAEGQNYTQEVRFDIAASKVVTSPLSNSYTIEVALKPMDGLKAGDTFNYCMQLNDIQEETAATVQCSGSQKPWEMDSMKLSATEVVYPTVEEPAVDEPAAEAPVEDATDIAPAPVAPATADAGIVVAAAIMAVAAGVVLSKKH